MDKLFALQILHSTGNLQSTWQNTLSIMNEIWHADYKRWTWRNVGGNICGTFWSTALIYLHKGGEETYKTKRALILSTGRFNLSVNIDNIKSIGFSSVASIWILFPPTDNINHVIKQPVR
jgi:hypothetical protein